MRTVLGILRRGLKILGWIGCGLSALLLVATVGLWVRNMGHWESWLWTGAETTTVFVELDPVPGARQAGFFYHGVATGDGHLWLESGTNPHRMTGPGEVCHQRMPSSTSVEQGDRSFQSRFAPVDCPWAGGRWRAGHFAGVGYSSQRSNVCMERFTLAIPFWMQAIVFGLWPGLVAGRSGLRWRRNRLRRKRLREGLCLHCGYDLRTTPDPAGPRLERCPECGREVVGKGR